MCLKITHRLISGHWSEFLRNRRFGVILLRRHSLALIISLSIIWASYTNTELLFVNA
jgi:hypothetical protein